MLAIAKITSKYQTTVPQEIRAILEIKPGDLIAWEQTADGAVQCAACNRMISNICAQRAQ
jgi:AbrB family looped-hinge helix DNA binding protein